jgi:hypothetical protein
MSLVKRLRNIALGSILLLSSIGCIQIKHYNLDTFPGGVGDVGLKKSAEHLEEIKKKKEDLGDIVDVFSPKPHLHSFALFDYLNPSKASFDFSVDNTTIASFLDLDFGLPDNVVSLGFRTGGGTFSRNLKDSSNKFSF